MSVYDYQQAFGAHDMTSDAMQKAIGKWFAAYYENAATATSDPCQRIAYTVVSKIVRAVFAEYAPHCEDAALQDLFAALDDKCKTAMQLALVGGECYLKPYISGKKFAFGVVPRNQILIFARNESGEPTDIGLASKCTAGNCYYTLLERRSVDQNGYLTIENKLYRSVNSDNLGTQVPLATLPEYAALAARYTFAQPVGSVGLVCVKAPMFNCIDGSADGVSIYAPAMGLIDNIDRNEALLKDEFERGQSRIIASRDLLQDGLTDHLFVGLDDDADRVGITIFAPELREQSFLARKQEYLRNVESVIGLKRGILSDANVEKRTATEITTSEGEQALTVSDFQKIWEKAVCQALALCALLGKLYGLPEIKNTDYRIAWGNGVLFDAEKHFEMYRQLVCDGILKPEIALGRIFSEPCDTPEQHAKIKAKYMTEPKS